MVTPEDEVKVLDFGVARLRLPGAASRQHSEPRRKPKAWECALAVLSSLSPPTEPLEGARPLDRGDLPAGRVEEAGRCRAFGADGVPSFEGF